MSGRQIGEMVGSRVLAVGSVNMDLVFLADRVPEAGETLIGTDFRQAPGGKGANQAVAAARLGAHVVLAANLGQDIFGHTLRASLTAHGVDTGHIGRLEDLPTGVAGIILDADGQNRIIVISGANAALTTADVERTWLEAGPFQAVLSQLEVPETAVRTAGTLATAAGIPFVLNPAPARPLADDLLALAAVLTPNESEAALLTGLNVDSPADAVRAAIVLRERGARNIVVTLGHRGLVLLDREGPAFLAAYPVKAVDTVGAGDAFTGALTACLGGGMALRDAARYAAAAAALAVTRSGAQDAMPAADEVDDFVQKRDRIDFESL